MFLQVRQIPVAPDTSDDAIEARNLRFAVWMIIGMGLLVFWAAVTGALVVLVVGR